MSSATPKMKDRFRRSTIRSVAPKLENQQSPTLDDQTHGAEDVGSARADARQPEFLRRRRKTFADARRSEDGAEDDGPAGANVRRSVARRRRWRISRRRHPTFRNMAPKMEDQRAPTTDDQKYGAESGGQVPTLDDQQHGAEDGGPAGATLDDH